MNKDQQHKLDIKYMKQALRLGKKGQGMVSPNPLVGALLVKNNQIIGEGYHKKYGEAHAEINAINSASQPLKDSTLYSTMEPCCHTDKQTPPCVYRIIKSGIKRVVVSSNDPNPKVNGRGLQLLKNSGIDVTGNILERENQQLNKFYFKYMKTRLPFVGLKIAQSLDGYISHNDQEQLWLTGKRSRDLVHRWRAIYDSVLIGANTLRVDNPQLTVRKGKKRNPLRIVVSGRADVDMDLKIFQQYPKNKTWLLTSQKNCMKLLKKMPKLECEVIGLPTDSDQHISLFSILEYLGECKITSVLVEGGQQIFSQFLTSGLWDELNVIIAPKILGRGVKSVNFEIADTGPTIQLHRIQKMDDDILLTFLPAISRRS